ncbi:hypothetical protein [Variovorax sp. dw_954]|uniref:hypothetical protein n=1 Tax=Variovorax sp. dw_954 TaxID=2720078 RepID=UPI001BD30A91|nr:hypothetical protein [Variovorax sp. dw_954]
MKNFGIVVIGFNRLNCLERLIGSLLRADYMGDKVDLIISLDKSESDVLSNYAAAVDWPHGTKQVINHKERIGLKRHVLKCGELTRTYENICVLEDDLYVSPGFYGFAKQAIASFTDFDGVAGISLYSYQWNQYANRPFQPIEDEYDAYLLKIASSWGQIWNRVAWADFMQWFEQMDGGDLSCDCLPSAVSQWSEKSWLKYHNRYLVDTGKYFVYPRQSLSTNFSEIGEHSRANSTTYQVSLPVRSRRAYVFPAKLSDSVRYDAFFENENLSHNLDLSPEEIDIDLYGTRPRRRRYLLSAERKKFKLVKSFGLMLRPIELNVVMKIPGEEIFLYDTTCAEINQPSRKRSSKRFQYEIRTDSKKELLKLAIVLYANAIRRRLSRRHNS